MEKVSSKKKVTAVIVTYNRKELLSECILALLNINYNNLNILIIDNASTDGTKKYIEKLLKVKGVSYYNTGENLGGAGGFNFGMKKALDLGCDYLWIMDDDTIVQKDSLNMLLKADEKLKGEYGFLSSKVLWTDNTICKMNIPKKTFSSWLKDYDTNYQTIEMASFVSLFLKSETVEKYGFPIKDFFIWTDDWEYTRRISRENKCYYITNSIVTHKCITNEGANIATVEGERINRFRYLYRNDCVLYRREGLRGKILFHLRIILHKLRVYKSNKPDKKERINIINNAIKEGKKFYPTIEYVPTDKKRILYMYGECLASGGQETFTLNVLNNIDKDYINIDLFTPYLSENKQIEDSVKKEKGIIYAYNGTFKNGKGNKKDFIVNTKKFLSKNANKYEIAHIHSGSAFALAIGAMLAKKYGIKKVIVHSHCTGLGVLRNSIIKFLFSILYKKYVDFYCACSIDALYWKFSKKLIKEDNYAIVKNGIEIKKFSYKEDIRKQYREKLDIKDKFVIINVARLSKEKNLLFLIETFKYVYDINRKATLLLVGDGYYKNILERRVNELNLTESVKFLGIRDDIYNILQAADVFVSTSFFEGLGISIIEAASSGLVVICSDGVPDDALVTNLCFKMKLKDGAGKWAKEILKHEKYKRTDISQEVNAKEYDVNSLSESLEKIYFDL